jgi:hypothetical protein
MDLATVHYVTFVELFGMLPTETLSFDDTKFLSNYTNKFFEFKKINHALCFEEHFFDAVALYKKY